MMPQFLMGMDHFLVASLVAKYTDFITASSVGKESLFLVYLRIFPLRFSMICEVEITVLVPSLATARTSMPKDSE